MHLPQVHDLRALLVSGTPLLDLRAPVEFAAGAVPGAENHPLLDDREREAIGIEHRQRGPAAALALGHQLVSGSTRSARMAAWIAWIERNPAGALYCFRGGSRSRITQAWLAEAGHSIPRVPGGFKALRRLLLEFLEQEAPGLPLCVVSGRTGSGKTRIVANLEPALDLEALARHRGSAFGRLPGQQPSQIDFEHGIAVRMLRHATAGTVAHRPPILVEDESKLIGQRLIPQRLLLAIRQAPQIRIDEPLESRADLIVEEYVADPVAALSASLGRAAAIEQVGGQLLESLDRIRNRLGGQRHAQLRETLQDALCRQRATGQTDRHRDWITPLLQWYYDPLYDHALQRQARTVPPLYSGRRSEVEAWLRAQGYVGPGADGAERGYRGQDARSTA